MAICVVEDQELQYVLPGKGILPAQVLVFQGTAYARISLLPTVSVEAATGLSEAQQAEALAGVVRHRDRLLAAWMPDARESFPQPRLAEEVRCRAAAYDKASRSLRLQLTNGAQLSLPLQRDPGFGPQDDARLAEVEVLCEGEFLRWGALKRYERASELLSSLLACAPASAAGRPVPDNAKPKSLLGLILYREGNLSREQLQGLFQEQTRLQSAGQTQPLGQLAVNSGFLTQDQLRSALELQEALAHASDQAKPLALHLLESASVKPSMLLEALKEHKASGRPLDDVLLQRGDTTESQLSVFRQQHGRVTEPAKPPVTEQSPAFVPMPEPTPAPAATPVLEATVPAASVPLPPPASSNSFLKTTLSNVKSLLGIILEREDYLSQSQVHAVMLEQERLRAEGNMSTFGEVALNLGFITQEQLKFAVQLQKKLAFAPGKPKPLGAILLENGVIKPSQVHLALQKQAETGKKLGEVLVEQGAISEPLLAVFLKMRNQPFEV